MFYSFIKNSVSVIGGYINVYFCKTIEGDTLPSIAIITDEFFELTKEITISLIF